MKVPGKTVPAVVLATALTACEPPPDADIRFRQTGKVESRQLDEISGLQASRRHSGVFWVHNDDDEARVHAVAADGADLGYFDIEDAVNVDWEDLTLVPGKEHDLLVLADLGDNAGARGRVWLYLVAEPDPDADGRFSGTRPAFHWISLAYPDGPHDTEAVSWDPVGQRLLALTKRDRPPRLYALDITTALNEDEDTFVFLGEVSRLRPPQPDDRRAFGDRAPWVSQPTGFDIAPDGSHAAVITYRSLYLFERPDGGGWLEGLNAEPVEILGPPGAHEEAVGFGADGHSIWVSGEGHNAPLWEFRLGDPAEE